MPRCKSPGHLLNISLKLVDDLIIKASAAIQEKYGSYDNKECKAYIEEFQRHLLTYVPCVVLEQVFNRSEQQRCCNSDNRIWFAIFMHKNMKLFQVRTNVRGNKADDSFWITNLARLNNLVELNLRLLCTDEILEVVGHQCLKLTNINITSKVESDVPDTSIAFPFNAMKLNFFVSDEGLRHLSNCKSLRVVKMSPLIRSQGGGRTMTLTGIRQFIKSLPRLQSVSYCDMGVVLSEGMDDVVSLPLVRITDIHPHVMHIRAIARLCPRLRGLFLTAAFDQTDTADVMDALQESNLQIGDLELANFPTCDSLINLIQVKGVFLTRLNMKICSITFDVVSNIGQFCPNIKHLIMREDFLERDVNRVEAPFSGCGLRCMYVNLECLQVYGSQWNPLVSLPMFLTHAKGIQSLCFLADKNYGYLDETFLQILEVNPFAELSYAFVDCMMGSQGIRAICRCPKLSYFKYVVNVCFTLNCIAEIKEEVANRNLDFKFLEIKAGGRETGELDQA